MGLQVHWWIQEQILEEAKPTFGGSIDKKNRENIELLKENGYYLVLLGDHKIQF